MILLLHIFPSLYSKTPWNHCLYSLSPTPSSYSLPNPNIMKAFKHRAKLKEFYNEHTFSHHLNDTINNMCFITYLSTYLSIIHPSIHLYYFWMHFKLKDISPLLLNTSAHMVLPINISLQYSLLLQNLYNHHCPLPQQNFSCPFPCAHSFSKPLQTHFCSPHATEPTQRSLMLSCC